MQNGNRIWKILCIAESICITVLTIAFGHNYTETKKQVEFEPKISVADRERGVIVSSKKGPPDVLENTSRSLVQNAPKGETVGDRLSKLRLSPKYARFLKAEALRNVWMNSGSAIRALNLSPEREQRLLELLADKYLGMQDAANIAIESGSANGDFIAQSAGAVSNNADQEIKRFLGDADYNHLQELKMLDSARIGVQSDVGAGMDMARIALTTDQLAALTNIEAHGNEADGENVASNTLDDRGLTAADRGKIDEASAVLTPAQLNFYRNWLIDNNQRNQLVATVTNDGAPATH